MAIVFDAVTSDQYSNAAGVTFSHTVAAGDNLGVIVPIFEWGGLITGISYGGDAMTKHAEFDPVGGALLQLYKLANPKTGANNVVVSSAAGGYGALAALSFSGVDQATMLRTAYTGQGSGSSCSVTVVNSVNGDVVIDVIGKGTGSDLVAGAGQTKRWEEIVAALTLRAGGSTENANGPNTVMSWTWTGTLGYWTLVASIIPAAAGGGIMTLKRGIW